MMAMTSSLMASVTSATTTMTMMTSSIQKRTSTTTVRSTKERLIHETQTPMMMAMLTGEITARLPTTLTKPIVTVMT